MDGCSHSSVGSLQHAGFIIFLMVSVEERLDHRQQIMDSDDDINGLSVDLF